VNRIDWRALLTKHRIPFIERGANVKRGELALKCPWCGAADPSQHLGINLQTGWYSCWRHKEGHSGKSPLRLLMQLLRIDYRAARELAGLGDDYVDPEGFDALVARLRGSDGHAKVVSKPPLELDPEFQRISFDGSTSRHWDYLEARGFDNVSRLCGKYGLVADRRGSRVIMPYTLEEKLVTWTGRAIAPATIRYKDLDRERSLVIPKETLYLFDHASRGGRVLCLVEGPIDALKLDHYGQGFGLHAVAMSTNSLSEQQVFLLEELGPKFDRVLVMADAKTSYGFVDSMRLKDQLTTVRTRGPRNVAIIPVPFNAGDAGSLSPDEAKSFAIQVTGGFMQ
jgi:hypothetical protein